MFRRDSDARLVHHSIFRMTQQAKLRDTNYSRVSESGYFLVKNNEIIGRLDIYSYDDIQRAQRSAPARIVGHGQKTWWIFSDQIYYTDETLIQDEVLARILDLMNLSSNQSRERIPEIVRHEVWRRDEGKCVSCGSREKLEFDHIIPVSKGGSNTARNIELLCESCNRKKSNKI